MSSQSLWQYFQTIASWAQAFIDWLPDEFLHESSKRPYQLINEINVYLRSGRLSQKEYDTVTLKTEQLIEEVEKLEIAYEGRNGVNHADEFSDAFKSTFDDVMTAPTYTEYRNSWMKWQTKGSLTASSWLHQAELPVLLASMIRGIYTLHIWLTSEALIVLIPIVLLLVGVWVVIHLLRTGRLLVTVMLGILAL